MRWGAVVMAESVVSEDSALRRWVQTRFGASAAPLDELIAHEERFDSLLLCRGPGAEPGEFSAEHFSAQRFLMQPDGSLLWGTAPVERGPSEELGLRLKDGRMVWMTQAQHPPLPAEPVGSPSPPPPHNYSSAGASIRGN